MALGLKLAFQSQRSRLVLKTVVYGFFLVVQTINGGFLSTALFFLAALLIYFSSPFNSVRLFSSFLVLTISAPIVISKLDQVNAVLAAVLAALLIYLILSIKDLALLHRDWWHFVVHLSLFYLVFLLFFLHYPEHPVGLTFLIFAVTFLMFVERFGGPLAIPVILSFLVTQAAWGIGMLPLGFLNSSGALLLVTFFLGDVIMNARRNTLTSRLILTDTTIVILAFLLIFGTTGWRI